MPDLGATIPTDGWERHSCGESSQGSRVYGWAYLPLRPALGQGWYRHITLALVALAVGASKRGRCPVPSTSPSPYLKSAGFSCAFSGPQPEGRKRSSHGPAGAVGIRESPSSVIGVAA